MPRCRRFLVIAGLLSGSLAGCGPAVEPMPASLPAPAAAGRVAIDLGVAEPRELLTAHRWLPSDIVRYTVTLERLDPTTNAYVAITQANLAQKTAPTSTRAFFNNLRLGRSYRASVVAYGNAGGNAAGTLQILNQATPCRVTFGFSGTQDVGDTLALSAKVALDPVPFAGTLRVSPTSVPTWVQAMKAELLDVTNSTPVVLSTVNTTPGHDVSFQNLKLGRLYQSRVTASATSDPTTPWSIVKTSASQSFDGAGADSVDLITLAQPMATVTAPTTSTVPVSVKTSIGNASSLALAVNTKVRIDFLGNTTYTYKVNPTGTSGPDGVSSVSLTGAFPFNAGNAYAVFGRFTESKSNPKITDFPVGRSMGYTPTKAGGLQLAVNDPDYTDNSNTTLTATVSVWTE